MKLRGASMGKGKKLRRLDVDKALQTSNGQQRTGIETKHRCQAPGRCTKKLFSAKYCLKHELMYGDQAKP